MDQSTTALAEEVNLIGRSNVTITEKSVTLEHRLMDLADSLPTTYSRLLKETADSVDRMVDQTTTALSPVHQTRAHPWTMLGAALCAGYAIARLQTRPCPAPFVLSPSTLAQAQHLRVDHRQARMRSSDITLPDEWAARARRWSW
jgi:hypothetical protein